MEDRVLVLLDEAIHTLKEAIRLEKERKVIYDEAFKEIDNLDFDWVNLK